MNSLETIGVFFCVICLTCFIWFILYMIVNGDDVDERIEWTSVSVIIVFIILFTIVISAYVSDERKIDEYKEKLSKYEEMEIEEE